MAWYHWRPWSKKENSQEIAARRGSVETLDAVGDSRGEEYIVGTIISSRNGSAARLEFDNPYNLRLKDGSKELPSVRITDRVIKKYSGDPKMMRLVDGHPERLEVTERFLRPYIGYLAERGQLRVGSTRVESEMSSTDVPIYNGEEVEVVKEVDASLGKKMLQEMEDNEKKKLSK